MSEIYLGTIVVCPHCNNRSSTVSNQYCCEVCGSNIEKEVNVEIASTNFISACLLIGFVSCIFILCYSIFN